MIQMKAVILAAGEGTRLWPLSENKPKPLVKIINKYFLEYQVIELVNAGINEIIIVKGKNFDSVFNSFKKEMEEKYHAKISFVIQPETLGTGDAFNRVKLDEPFIGLMGDNHYESSDIKKIVELFKTKNKSVIGGFVVNNPESYGVIEHDGDKVIRLVEKPKRPATNVINTGIYLFKPNIYNDLSSIKPHENGEFYITDAINKLASEGEFLLFKLNSWSDLGKPYQILDMTKYFFTNYSKYNDMKRYTIYEKNVFIGKNVVIGKGAEFYPENGFIIVEDNSKILGSTLVFGSNYIGPECTIKNSIIRETTVLVGKNNIGTSEIKNSTLGLESNAPHFNYIGDSYIGDECNFGAGAKVANVRHDKSTVKMFIEKKGVLEDTKRTKLGIFTGDNVKVGINACLGQPGILIGSYAKIPPGAKIVRNVSSGAPTAP
jgi:UDP-N-acetylglucosamine diphosphorylase/glucosamine-1-phosphate N-acetyltransferase